MSSLLAAMLRRGKEISRLGGLLFCWAVQLLQCNLADFACAGTSDSAIPYHWWKESGWKENDEEDAQMLTTRIKRARSADDLVAWMQ